MHIDKYLTDTRLACEKERADQTVIDTMVCRLIVLGAGTVFYLYFVFTYFTRLVPVEL